MFVIKIVYLIISRTPFPYTPCFLCYDSPLWLLLSLWGLDHWSTFMTDFGVSSFTLRPSNWHHPHEPSSWLQKAERNRLMPQNRVTNKCSCQSLVSSQETPLNPPWLRNASLIATLSTWNLYTWSIFPLDIDLILRWGFMIIKTRAFPRSGRRKQYSTLHKIWYINLSFTPPNCLRRNILENKPARTHFNTNTKS